jgi:hypothetical protein
MLPDQVQYYGDNEPIEELRYGYKHKRTDDVEMIAIAECHVCGTLMAEQEEVITDGHGTTFCGEPCRDEYEQMMGDGEL